MKTINRILVFVGLIACAGGTLAQPITSADTVIVGGNEWAQPDLFANLSWNEINAVCPGGVCVDGGMLNGHDMNSMIWASIDDVNALLNVYLSNAGVSGEDLLGSGVDSYQQTSSAWASDFYSAGWRPTLTNLPALQTIRGWTSELHWDEVTEGLIQWSPNNAVPDGASTGNIFTSDSLNYSDETVGAWFYRPASTGPTVDLVFSATTGSGTTGSNTIRARAGDILTLDIVVTDNDSLGICAAVLSLYWDAGMLTGSNAEACPAPPNIAAGTCNDSTGLSHIPSLPVDQAAGSAEDFNSGADCLIGGPTLGFISESMTLGRTQLLVETQATSEITIGYLPGQGIVDGTLTPEHQPAATATVLPPAGC